MLASLYSAISMAALVLFTLFSSTSPASAQVTPGLVEVLEKWIDANTDLPRAKVSVRLRIKDAEFLDDLDREPMAIGRRTRGLYDPETSTITLIRPWSVHDVEDVSVLLHELVHHRQSEATPKCRPAWEFQAYKLQEEWMSMFGQTLDVNWAAIGIGSNCRLSDVHPD